MQETFEIALRGLSGLKSADRLGPWLRQIAVRQCHRRFRRQRMLDRLGISSWFDSGTEELSLDQLGGPSLPAEHRLELALLDRKLGKLEHRNRTACYRPSRRRRHVPGDESLGPLLCLSRRPGRRFRCASLALSIGLPEGSPESQTNISAANHADGSISAVYNYSIPGEAPRHALVLHLADGEVTQHPFAPGRIHRFLYDKSATDRVFATSSGLADMEETIRETTISEFFADGTFTPVRTFDFVDSFGGLVEDREGTLWLSGVRNDFPESPCPSDWRVFMRIRGDSTECIDLGDRIFNVMATRRRTVAAAGSRGTSGFLQVWALDSELF